LCDYYRKSGFIENAYVSTVEMKYGGSIKEFKCSELNSSDFFNMRNRNFKKSFIWDINSLKYILKENKFTGGENLIVFHNNEPYFAILKKNMGYITVSESDFPPQLRSYFSDYLCIRYGCRKVMWILPDSEESDTLMLYGMTYNLTKDNYYFNHILN